MVAKADSKRKNRTAPNPVVGAAGEQLSCNKYTSNIAGNNSSFNIFQAVKQTVTTRQVAEYYGLKIQRNGMACCPFHPDRHPSLKLDQRFHCFGCGADGDVIDYVERLTGLSKYDSAVKIAEDFGIPHQGHNRSGRLVKVSPEMLRRREQTKQSNRIRQKLIRWSSWAIDVLKEYVRNMEEWKKTYAPKDMNEEPHPLFLEAMHNLSIYEYYLDILCFIDGEEQLEFFLEMKEEVRKIDERNKSGCGQSEYRETA